MLLHTGTEEIAHIEMLATAVANNLEGAPLEMEEAAKDPIMLAKLGGMSLQQVITTCHAARPIGASGVSFSASHVYATGKLGHDMLANAVAESSGRMLAVQLYRMTDDPGMKDMLSFLIARDTMHQNQWMAAYEELGGPKAHPIPTNFPMEKELQDVSYSFFLTGTPDAPKYEGPAREGKSYDGRGTFKPVDWQPKGEVPDLGPASPKTAAQPLQTKAQPGVGQPARK